MTNKCGSCALCCKVMGITELAKPRDQWCPHCSNHDCKIYESRPQTCRDFECVWLQTQSTDEPLPPELRPDRCHVVFDGNATGEIIAHVDKAYPDAWDKGHARRAIDLVLEQGSAVIVTCGMKRKVLRKGRPTLDSIAINKDGLQPESVEVPL